MSENEMTTIAHADGSAAIQAPAVGDGVLLAVAEGRYHEPHSVLGQHLVAADGVADRVTVIRALRPLARSVTAVLATGARVSLGHLGHGVWQGVSVLGPQPYLLEARYEDDAVWTAEDPYRFTPTIGELDLHLIREGRHERLWDALGAHHREHEGVSGTAFTVWAPNATAVRVAGDFNDWNGVASAMRSMGASGVWELFLPGVEPGAVYKFELRDKHGQWSLKADPLARLAEVPPATGSVVTETDYVWDDRDWMLARRSHNPHTGPMSVYELHLGSWRPGLGYREAADALIDYLTPLGSQTSSFTMASR